MRIRFSVHLLLLFMIRSGSAMDHVTANDGNIVLENSSGHLAELTHTGLDSDPWLSPDGRAVVFLRHGADDVFRTSVYEIDVGTGAVRLLYGGPARYQGHESSYFGRPELDEAGDSLYLLSKNTQQRDHCLPSDWWTAKLA